MHSKHLFGALCLSFLVAGCDKNNVETCAPNWCKDEVKCEDTSVDDLKTIGDRVFFGLNKSSLSSEAMEIVKAQAAWLAKCPAVHVTIEGHCDERGTSEYNLALGERRAHAVKLALVNHGIDSSRIKTVSFGKERPDALGHHEKAWSKNRRAVMSVR